MNIERIAVVGSGAVGCYYGAKLAQSGHAVSFLMRTDLAHVSEHGLVIDSNDVDGSFTLPKVDCAGTTAEIGEVDLVIVALKTTDNQALDTLLPPLLGPDTLILTLQNGLGNEDYLAERFGKERILGGLCFVCLNRTAPGQIHHIGHGLIELGEHSSDPQPRTHLIADRLRDSGVPCEVLESLQLSRWRKLVWNIPFNGLSIAAGGIDVGQILADPILHKRVLALMKEVVETAALFGYEIPEAFIEENITRTYPMGAYRPSSLLDYLAGRAVEVESIWGEPLRRAQTVGAAVPELASLYTEIKTAVGG